MEFLKLQFWINLILVIITTYIATWYILTPSNNQCQMTFMMEPPKFLPVPVDDTISDSALDYSNIDFQGSKRNDNTYKLYMYSEFGFPQASNVRRDLRDSMPVLFVPGNAGSYQQVRSLASTCIRHQLQSLDAFKFIFYTIDFRGQLSGISGQLIEDQTLFVQKSLHQIAKMHPSETNGIILIGHSVGGFISKVLFTMPSFDPISVPLLISLASPLTSPYLTFDDKIRKLYQRTKTYWEDKESRGNSTIAISISGGIPDRLVPMHLSMDPHYDLSLTTSSMKDVWLTTDHVCITWCKELMQKLSHLLSALMDKKQTRLISEREVAISIIKKELLIDTSSNKENNNVIYKDWKSMRSHKIVDLEEYFQESRSHLGDSIIILKLNNHLNQDILINIDYIETLKENGVFGCSDVNLNSTNGQISCLGRMDLMQLAYVIPSRRFEPKRLAIRLGLNESNSINYIVFDFLSYAGGHLNRLEHRLPEMLAVQKLDATLIEESIYIPSVLEYLFKKLFFIDRFQHDIFPNKAFPLIYLRYKIVNLKQKTQIYTVNYKSHSCSSSEHPNGATIIFSQGGYLTESFHPATSDKDILSVHVKIASRQAVRFGEKFESNIDQSYLDLYIDGTCKNSFYIELDLLALVVDLIQKSLSKIMTCTSLFVYLAVVSDTFNLINDRQVDKINFLPGDNSVVTGISSFIIIYTSSDYLSGVYERNQQHEYVDQFVSIILIYILSHGLLAFFDYFIRRVIDLAIIINNAQSLLRQKISDAQIGGSTTSTADSQSANGSDLNSMKKSNKTDFDWLLITVAISGGIMFSPALLAIFTLCMVIRLKLSLDVARNKENEITCSLASNKHCPTPNDSSVLNSNHIHDLVTNIAVFSVLALISTIPSALVKINSSELTSLNNIFNPFYRDMSFLATTFSLISVKVICDVIEAEFINDSIISSEKVSINGQRRPQFVGPLYSFLKLFSTKYLHPLTLAPIMMIESNICHLTLAFTITMSWSSGYLLSKSSSNALGNRKIKK